MRKRGITRLFGAIIVLAIGAQPALARTGAHPAKAGGQVTSAAPLSHALGAGGKLRHVSGSFNARGYRMVLGANGAPRFVPAARTTGTSTNSPIAPPATGDSLWSENFGEPGMDGPSVTVTAIAISGSKIYVGGSFHKFGLNSPVDYNNLAMWDGHGWHTLSGGTTGGTNSGEVNAIALLGSDVYVGGNFTTAGTLSVNGIAKWNAATGWSAPAGGITQVSGAWVVNALAATGTAAAPTVYAAGMFNSIGGTSVNNIAVYNGTNWAALASGLTGSAGEVYALLLDGSTLYAGGNFSTSGTTKFNSLAAWNGSAWNAVGGGGISTSGGYPATVYALIRDPATDTLYIGGSFAEVGGTLGVGGVATGATPAANIASYNNGTWNTLAGGIAHRVDSLAWWNGKPYASYVVSFVANISQWNGTSWSALATPVSGGSSSRGPQLYLGQGGLLAAGGFTYGGSTVLNGFGLWTGTKWKGYGLGLTGSTWALAALSHDLYAVGGFTTAGTTQATNVAHFNGTSWVSMGSTGIAGSGQDCGAEGIVNNICAVAIDPVSHHVFIGGSFSSINGVPASNVAMWDGSAWHGLGQGTDGVVEALLVYGGKLYAGGHFANADGLPANDFAQWNLKSGGWTQVGGNVQFMSNGQPQQYVNAIAAITTAPYSGYLLIGGGFTGITNGTASATTNGLALFNTAGGPYTDPLTGYYYLTGNNGGSAGVGAGGAVYALYVDGLKLYIGGHFSSAGGIATTALGMCDLGLSSNCWSVPGQLTGANGTAFAITKSGPSIYVAGSFTGAGGVAAANIAQYTPGAATPWAALGAGLSASASVAGESVYGLAPSADGLYAGGQFGLAGASTPSADVALWTATALKLAVTNVASPSPTTVGTNTTFTATVSNTDTASASGVTLTSSVPANANYVSASASQGSCTLTGSTIKCNLGALGAKGSGTDTATVSIVLTPKATGKLAETVKAGESGTTITDNVTTTDVVN